MEEAGCTISDIEPIADYLSSPGATSETVALYCGRTESKNLGGLYGLAEEGEDIRVHTFSFSAIVKMLERAEITNAMTLIALQWLDCIATEWHRNGWQRSEGRQYMKLSAITIYPIKSTKGDLTQERISSAKRS